MRCSILLCAGISTFFSLLFMFFSSFALRTLHSMCIFNSTIISFILRFAQCGTHRHGTLTPYTFFERIVLFVSMTVSFSISLYFSLRSLLICLQSSSKAAITKKKWWWICPCRVSRTLSYGRIKKNYIEDGQSFRFAAAELFVTHAYRWKKLLCTQRFVQ